MLMKLDTLMLRGNEVRLTKPVLLSVKQSTDGLWYVSSRELCAYGVGHSVPAAVEDLCETFWWIYTELHRTPVNELDSSATTFLDSVGEYLPSSAAA